jgi:hypothetical protein
MKEERHREERGREGEETGGCIDVQGGAEGDEVEGAGKVVKEREMSTMNIFVCC